MEDEKYVDESWKEAVASEKNKEEEKTKLTAKSEQESPPQELPSEDFAASAEGMPEVNFIGYITSLAFQAMIFLGEVHNPMNDKIEKNLTQAKFIIDTIVLLREKTLGNLNTQETDTLNALIYELQMKYVEAVEKEGKA